MLYDVVPIQTRYRGIGRCLEGADFYPNESKTDVSQLLSQYTQSLDQWQNPPSQQGLAKLMELCSLLRQFHFPCEVIVYDSTPLERAYGYGLEFLGVDVALENSTCEPVPQVLHQAFFIHMCRVFGLLLWALVLFGALFYGAMTQNNTVAAAIHPMHT